jgi:uncharacterized protein (DUF58 family)
MDLKSELVKAPLFENLGLLAKQVVEGYISGIHKSPFHGYSAEFAEHRIYNTGESTKHVDWKLYAKTDKLYTKRYEEETNLRCHLILDNSASMYYPPQSKLDLQHLNKIGFATLASAAIMELLKKQRDAVGLSIFSENYQYFAPEKGSERHHQMLLSALNGINTAKTDKRKTQLPSQLHLIAEKLKRRSLIILFSDLLDNDAKEESIFEALRHLRYNKHEVILFHLNDFKAEIDFEFENSPKRFYDVESGEYIDLFPDTVRKGYRDTINTYLTEVKSVCARYGITYTGVDIAAPFSQVFNTFLTERKRFA